MAEDTGVTPATNPLAMSDEDFLNFRLPEEEPSESSENLETSEEIDNNNDEEELNDVEDASVEEVTEDEEEGSETLEDTETEDDEDFEEDTQDEDTDSEDEEDDSDEGENTSNETDLAKELFAPLKANGREYNVDNVQDARTLMSMGLNYNKKMQVIKPHLKVIRTLDKQGLLDLDKINNLIDLAKGDKNAITKLITDNDIDPLDINKEDAAEYSPKSYTASDEEVQLEQVLSDIKDTATFSKFQSELESSKWDETSKSVFVKEPELLVTINDQIANGIYDQIMERVEMERALGNHNGMSTLEAYQAVGVKLHNEGKLVTQKSTPPANKPPKPKAKVDPKKLKQKKKVASTPRGKTSNNSSTKKDIDYLSMSDEEFMKQFSNTF